MTMELLFNIFIITLAVILYIVSIIVRLIIKRPNGFEAMLMIACISFIPPVFWLCGEHPLGFIVGVLAAFSVTLQLLFPTHKYISNPPFSTPLKKETEYCLYLFLSGMFMSIVELLWFPAPYLVTTLSAGNGLMLFVVPTLLPAIFIDSAMPYNDIHIAGLKAAIIISQLYITASVLRLLPHFAESKGKRIFFGAISFIPVVNFFVSIYVQDKLNKQIKSKGN